MIYLPVFLVKAVSFLPILDHLTFSPYESKTSPWPVPENTWWGQEGRGWCPELGSSHGGWGKRMDVRGSLWILSSVFWGWYLWVWKAAYMRFRYHIWAEVANLGQLTRQPVSQFLYSLQRGGEFGIISVTLRRSEEGLELLLVWWHHISTVILCVYLQRPLCGGITPTPSGKNWAKEPLFSAYLSFYRRIMPPPRHCSPPQDFSKFVDRSPIISTTLNQMLPRTQSLSHFPRPTK